MLTFKRAVDALSKLFGLVAVLLLIASVLVVTQMVFVRYVLVESTIWQTEFVTYSIVAATFLGGPYVLLLKGHVRVDLIENAVGENGKLALRYLSDLLSFVFSGLLAWAGWLYFHEAWVENWTTDTVWALPLWIPLLPMPVGFGLLCLQFIADFIGIEDELQ
ncbi:MAG: TRAP transporter small permease [Hyphomicrobiales bacterium]|nr:TRAP transporter small permease [Hyphomicrobiales bacterium]